MRQGSEKPVAVRSFTGGRNTKELSNHKFTYLDFFAGGGMVRVGLGDRWRCLFANDFDPMKGAGYRRNFGPSPELIVDDIRRIKSSSIPGAADLAWASFPCQDLSVAGAGRGLKGERSGTFWAFWEHVRSFRRDGRQPAMIVLENVCGALTSHKGKDFSEICRALAYGGYRFGALVIDAVHFLPQSRPRLFIIGVQSDLNIPDDIIERSHGQLWQPPALVEAHKNLSGRARHSWVWWSLPAPRVKVPNLTELIEQEPSGVAWHTHAQTSYILSLMSPKNCAKVALARKLGRLVVGGVYRRTRKDEQGAKLQRAEVRFDEVAGCLRTPTGGSSRQTILVVHGDRVRSRLLSAREAARLMGLPDSYQLPDNYNSAYHIVGDGVAVPVVRYIAHHVLERVLTIARRDQADNAA